MAQIPDANLKGQDYIDALGLLPVTLDATAARPRHPDKKWDNEDDLPPDEILHKSGAKVTMGILRNLGIVAGTNVDKKEQLKLDADSTVS